MSWKDTFLIDSTYHRLQDPKLVQDDQPIQIMPIRGPVATFPSLLFMELVRMSWSLSKWRFQSSLEGHTCHAYHANYVDSYT